MIIVVDTISNELLQVLEVVELIIDKNLMKLTTRNIKEYQLSNK